MVTRWSEDDLEVDIDSLSGGPWKLDEKVIRPPQGRYLECLCDPYPLLLFPLPFSVSPPIISYLLSGHPSYPSIGFCFYSLFSRDGGSSTCHKVVVSPSLFLHSLLFFLCPLLVSFFCLCFRTGLDSVRSSRRNSGCRVYSGRSRW